MYKELFSDRHNSLSTAEEQEMVQMLGYNSIEQLISQTIPDEIRLEKELNLDEALTEVQLLEKLKNIGNKNIVAKSYIGMGYYGTHTPKVILRNILENPGWYTQYTPYQAEIAQGRLEALLNFQTMVCDLTGMALANASLLDEATAAAEAMAMLYSAKSKTSGDKIFVSDKAFPQTIDVIQTRAEPLGIEVVLGNANEADLDEEYFALFVQYPNGEGSVEDYAARTATALEKGVKTIVAADILALTLLKAPGEWGAEVVIGSTQRFGVPMGNGGPHAAYFATKEEHKRRLPGRIIGVSQDSNGKYALRMALQTREQHIKRDKATSNICTAQALLAVMAGMYAAYHGPIRLKAIAEKVNQLTSILANNLTALGYELKNTSAFDTLAISISNSSQKELKAILEAEDINIRYTEDLVCISLDETTELDDVAQLVMLFAKAVGKEASFTEKTSQMWDLELNRDTAYLEHPVFNTYHTEHEMLRYLKTLENKDLSLAHSMIALGSCTMKLNATSEMIPVTWESFGNIHPFAPKYQLEGYTQ
ncbi:MAG: glycine dehydrogenase, partial [Bacteroidia bacterium]